MSWLNELKPEIKLTSPNGQEFYALWQNNERTKEKKLGVFEIPNFRGSIIQDLDIKSDVYPLTIFFQGPFHNVDAQQFWKALDEVGQWEIIHPVKGPLILQFVGGAEAIAPVDTGNYTGFTLNWLEPANIERVISPDELAVSTLTQIFNTIDDALIQLQQLVTTSYALVQSAKNVLNKTVGYADMFLTNISTLDDISNDAYLSARSTFDTAIELFTVDNPGTDDTGNALVDVFTSPIEASTDFTLMFSEYSDMITEMQTLSPTSITEDDKSKIQSLEYGLSIALIAISQIVISSTFSNRSEIISAIENLFDVFNSVVVVLEEVQSNFSNNDIDLQYFSQTSTYTSLINLYTLTYRYLLSQFFNLSSEKRFIIKNKISPIEVTVQEYGSLGEDDANYDLFITSNQLSGSELLLLYPGREVVIYA